MINNSVNTDRCTVQRVSEKDNTGSLRLCYMLNYSNNH